MNEKTENYEIINGILMWINPKLEELTIPKGIKVISLQYYLDRSLYMSCKLKRIISSEMVIIDPKMIDPFYKKGVKVIIENDNYKVVNGNLIWINPKLKEFTIPRGVIEVSLSEVTDISNLEIIKTEAIQTTSNLKLNYIDFDKFPNLSTIYVTRNWYFFGKISIDRAILPDNFKYTIDDDVIRAKKVVIYEDNSERACFSNWYAPLNNSIVEEITIPNYINFVSLNKESLPGVKALNYTGDFLGSVSLASYKEQKYISSSSYKEYPIRLPNLQQINITFNTEEDLIKNLLSLNMLRQLQNSIEGFVGRTDKETTGKEHNKNRKLAEEQYQNIKLNFVVGNGKKETFADDLNIIFNSCENAIIFYALMEYIYAYCVNNDQDKIETVKEAAKNLKNKKEVSICLYNLLCTIKPILLESDMFYCVDRNKVLFAEVIKNYQKLKNSAIYEYHISDPHSDLIGNQYGHSKLLNDFLFTGKESSEALSELLTELEKMYTTLQGDIVSIQYGLTEKVFAKAKERLKV